MNLYYTVVAETNREQYKPELSLGGYKSSTIIPNDMFGNIIQDTSIKGLEKQTPYYIGLVMKNETGFNVQDVLFWFEYPENGIIEIEIAAVDLNSSGAMEKISNQYSRPYQASFYKANGELNAVSLGEMANNEEIGVWLKIGYSKDTIINNNLNETIISNYNNPQDQVKSLSIKVNWTEVVYYGGGLGEDNL